MQMRSLLLFLSVILFSITANAQYDTTTPEYVPPSTPYYGQPTSCTTGVVTITSLIPTTITSLTTTTSITTTTLTSLTTIYSDVPKGYSYSGPGYMTPMKKKTALIIGLVVGLCGLALVLLIGWLLHKRNKKPKVLKYGADETPATGY